MKRTREGLWLALAVVALHVVVNATTPYGVHRDEFLYMAMGRHLRLWRMDFPPLIAIAAQASRLFGDSLVAIRIVPALAAGAIVFLTWQLAERFGGGRRAQWLASLAVIASPLFLRAGSLFQPVVLDQLWWTLGYYALARIADGDDARTRHRWWLLLGAIAGVGLLTKFSIAFFAVGVLAAILVTTMRRSMLTPWPWLALVIAVVIGSPSITGQVALSFPVLGQMQDLQHSQLQRVTAAEFIGGQVLLGPSVALALGGFVALLVGPMRRYRAIGIATASTFVLLLVLHGKAYYVGPIYPALFAAGAAALESLVAKRAAAPHRERVVLAAAAFLIVAYGALTLPFGLPILSPAPMAKFASAMGPQSAVATNRGEALSLPQDYADMLGWPEQADAVVRAYDALTPAERARVTIAAGNYGEAGALDFHASRRGLPRTISAAGSYWFFGPGDRSGDPALVLANRDAADDLGRLYGTVKIVEAVRYPRREWLVPEERGVVVFRCDGARAPIAQVWPSLAGRQ